MPSRSTPQMSNAATSQGNLLGVLTVAFYILFTLLPDSNTTMVQWPWILFWQVGLLCPVLWLVGMLWQKRVRALGNGLDWLVLLLVLVVLLSTGLAVYPMPARWYSWAALCGVGALYALNSWLVLPGRSLGLLKFQAGLSLAFIVLSLGLWTAQILVPEILRLWDLQALGVSLPFDFANIRLRNASPLGHQNYVAGYLVLALPLLVGLGIGQKGWQRWFWLGGAGLGCVDLYTTSSRAGWLGLLVLVLVGGIALLGRSALSRLWFAAIALVSLTSLTVLGLANSRLRETLLGLGRDQGGGELAYRLITGTTGWRMGSSHWWSGVGLGGVPLLYQQYRPAWAGREAELHYQLHSTPVQLWAEMGLGAVLVGVGTIALFVYLSLSWLKSSHSCLPRLLPVCLFAGLLAYAIVSLFDYQLDNLPISGTLIIYAAILATELRTQKLAESDASPSRQSLPSLISSPLLPLSGCGLILAILVWLLPIHQARMLASQGFAALSRQDVNGFVQQLSQAQQQAAWDAYYAHQLGWNLGNLGLQVSDPSQQQRLTLDGITWLQKGIEAAPQQEFGYSSTGWLGLNRDPKAATQAFAQSAQLVPAKRGAFYGLGLGLLAQKQSDRALDAFTLEILRDPQLLTSPIWALPDLQPLYRRLTQRVDLYLTTLLKQPLTVSFNNQLHQIRGGIRWWLGDVAGARADLQQYGTALSRMVLDLTEGNAVQAQLDTLPTSGGALAIAAWFNPSQRQSLLQRAWIVATKTAPDEQTLKALVDSMTRSTRFEQWLKQNAPTRSYRRERAGFGVNSRHGDGPAPVDFWTVIENIPLTTFFAELLPSPVYAPELDNALQPERDRLLSAIR